MKINILPRDQMEVFCPVLLVGLICRECTFSVEDSSTEVAGVGLPAQVAQRATKAVGTP